jgi:hypothetical protein
MCLELLPSQLHFKKCNYYFMRMNNILPLSHRKHLMIESFNPHHQKIPLEVATLQGSLISGIAVFIWFHIRDMCFVSFVSWSRVRGFRPTQWLLPICGLCCNDLWYFWKLFRTCLVCDSSFTMIYVFEVIRHNICFI